MRHLSTFSILCSWVRTVRSALYCLRMKSKAMMTALSPLPRIFPDRGGGTYRELAVNFIAHARIPRKTKEKEKKVLEGVLEVQGRERARAKRRFFFLIGSWCDGGGVEWVSPRVGWERERGVCGGRGGRMFYIKKNPHVGS